MSINLSPTEIYRLIILLTAAESVVLGGIAYYRNRARTVGAILGLLLSCFGLWLYGFSHYFHALPPASAWMWAKFTLTLAVLNSVLYLHAICLYLETPARHRWTVSGISYASMLVFWWLLWTNRLILELRPHGYMEHYPRLSTTMYAALCAHIVVWPSYALVLQALALRRFTGFRRNQLLYFFVAALIVHLTTNAAIMPIEYGITMPPIGFFLLPLNLGLMGYALSKARLEEFNLAISKVLVHTVALLIVVVVAGLAIAVLQTKKPDFLGPPQTLFVLALVAMIGVALSLTLPRLLPEAERIVAEKLFGAQIHHHELLRVLLGKMSATMTTDDLLQTVLDQLVPNLKVQRAAVFLHDELSGQMSLRASFGRGDPVGQGETELAECPAILTWLTRRRGCLVADELARQSGAAEYAQLQEEFKKLDLAVCVPMILDQQMVGFLGLSAKQAGGMFSPRDLEFLETVATETAMGLRYRGIQEELFRKNRLIELGTIAAGVAHEIRNPLASIRTFAQLMPSKMDDPEFKNEFSKLVLKDVDRISKVVESMLAFARPGHVTIAEHLATELVEEAILLVQSRLKSKHIELTRQFHEHPSLRVDKQQILQVLVNLFNNAVDALPEHGKIRVVTGVRLMEDALEKNGSQRYGVIEVANNGPAIPVAVRNRLFDPFFTTKKEGTGLGLSISQKIVRDHGGLITVSSIEGKGTAFQVNLPLG